MTINEINLESCNDENATTKTPKRKGFGNNIQNL